MDIEEGNKQLTAAAIPVALIRVHLPCICDAQTLDFHRIHSNIYRRQARVLHRGRNVLYAQNGHISGINHEHSSQMMISSGSPIFTK